MSERFVFDIDNNIIKIKNVGETVARLSDFRVNFGNRLVFVIKTKFIGASQHTVRLIALEFTNAEAEIFIAIGRRNDGSRSNPSRKHAGMNIGRATNYLNGFTIREFLSMRTSVNLTKIEVRARNLLGTDNLNDIDAFIFRREVNYFFNFNQARTDKFDQFFGREVGRN